MKREASSLLRSSQAHLCGVGADLRRRWLLLPAAAAVALFGAWARGGAERSSARRPFLAPANYLDPFNAADARTLAPHYAAFVAAFAAAFGPIKSPDFYTQNPPCDRYEGCLAVQDLIWM